MNLCLKSFPRLPKPIWAEVKTEKRCYFSLPKTLFPTKVNILPTQWHILYVPHKQQYVKYVKYSYFTYYLSCIGFGFICFRYFSGVSKNRLKVVEEQTDSQDLLFSDRPVARAVATAKEAYAVCIHSFFARSQHYAFIHRYSF